MQAIYRFDKISIVRYIKQPSREELGIGSAPSANPKSGTLDDPGQKRCILHFIEGRGVREPMAAYMGRPFRYYLQLVHLIPFMMKSWVRK